MKKKFKQLNVKKVNFNEVYFNIFKQLKLMIIWLASYPKSGNTWLRTIIGQFFENDFNGDKVFKKSKKIRVYPSKIDYSKIDEIFNSEIYPHEKKKKFQIKQC